jgi:S1-C subfamily serine protease
VEPTDWPYSAVCEITAGTAGGSGTLVAVNKTKLTGVVITCAHIFEGSRTPHLTFPSGYKCKGQLLAADHRHDLAAVRIPIKADMQTPRRIRAATKDDGVVLAVGYPWYGDGLHWTQGKVLGYSGTDVHFAARPFIHSGFSGGSLFASNGDYLGPTNGYGEQYSYAASGQNLVKFVSRFCKVEP